jgi:hypothetical protein
VSLLLSQVGAPPAPPPVRLRTLMGIGLSVLLAAGVAVLAL